MIPLDSNHYFNIHLNGEMMCFKVVSETVKWRSSSNGRRYLVPDWSCRGEGTQTEFGFHYGNIHKILASRTKQTTGMVVGN